MPPLPGYGEGEFQLRDPMRIPGVMLGEGIEHLRGAFITVLGDEPRTIGLEFPTNPGIELPNVYLASGLEFQEGFTRKERKMIQSVVREYGFNLGGIRLWRSDGAPAGISASWDPNYGITFYDRAFSSRAELAKSIFEELIHRSQGLTEFGGGNVQAAEDEAEEKLRKWWRGK